MAPKKNTARKSTGGVSKALDNKSKVSRKDLVTHADMRDRTPAGRPTTGNNRKSARIGSSVEKKSKKQRKGADSTKPRNGGSAEQLQIATGTGQRPTTGIKTPRAPP